MEKISIFFYLNNRYYTSRHTIHIPRIHDEIMLPHNKTNKLLADSSGKVAFKITRVVWGIDEPEYTDSFQSVNIEIETITN